jgi:redox-sensitive bicupin YhaK (pirin superfamily)
MFSKKILRKMSLVKQYFPNKGEGGSSGMRLIGNEHCKMLDPFILLAYFSMRLPMGFPDHPHRRFETVTHMTEG